MCTDFNIKVPSDCGLLLHGEDVIYSCGKFSYFASFGEVVENEIDHVFLYSPIKSKIDCKSFQRCIKAPSPCTLKAEVFRVKKGTMKEKQTSKYKGFYTAIGISILMIGAACVYAYQVTTETNQTLEKEWSQAAEETQPTTNFIAEIYDAVTTTQPEYDSGSSCGSVSSTASVVVSTGTSVLTFATASYSGCVVVTAS